jgi:hypothetical protein
MFYELKRLLFFLLFFHYSLSFSTSKMISKAWGSTPITFYITQREAQMMKIKEVIGDRVVIDDGQFYLKTILQFVHLPLACWKTEVYIEIIASQWGEPACTQRAVFLDFVVPNVFPNIFPIAPHVIPYSFL